MRILFSVSLLILFTLSAACSSVPKKRITSNSWQQATQEVIAQYGPQTETRLNTRFNQAGVKYPPKQVALLTFKQERNVELWAADYNSGWRHVHTYPMTAKSGYPGPKLREFDHQIPEGVYSVVQMNPFSSYHLSMMLDYPNAYDQHRAKLDGRTQLGDNIFIHGRSRSVGCIAVGDRAMNELYILVARVGMGNTQVIIAPNDLRHKTPAQHPNQPSWTPALYAKITHHLTPFQQSIAT